MSAIRGCAKLAAIWVIGHGSSAGVPDRVDLYVQAQMRERHLPGLSLAVVHRGRIIKMAGYGLANVQLGVSASPSSVYELASMTKQFTATAIMILAGEHKLSLEDTISKYVRDVPDTWRGVTIRHLLTHTSGIADHTELPVVLNDESRDYTRAQMLDFIAGAPVKFPPGEQWAYNDSGYFLLGIVVEKASGQPYDQFVRERIFQPVGMVSTRGNVIDDAIPGRVAGYVLSDGRLRRGMRVSPTQSFGGGHLISTVVDLVKWDQALAGEMLLPRSAIEAMWTPARLNSGRSVEVNFPGFGSTYGFGWFLGELNGHRIVEHGGSISSGFSSEILRLPNDELTVIVLTNRSSGQGDPMAKEAPRPWAIARGIAALYLPDLGRQSRGR